MSFFLGGGSDYEIAPGAYPLAYPAGVSLENLTHTKNTNTLSISIQRATEDLHLVPLHRTSFCLILFLLASTVFYGPPRTKVPTS